MGKGVAGLVVAVIAALAMLLASSASAATLTGDYQLQGTRASSGPGPALLDVGGVNAFQSDTVQGSSRQVLRFPLHSGVQMFPAGIGGPSAAYSIVTTFKLDAVDGYRRILDPSAGDGDDRGLYDLDGELDIYPDGSSVTSPTVLAPNTWATVAVTTLPLTQTKVYLDGNPVVQSAASDETIPIFSDTMRFFKDNDSATTNEDSAGAVSCIRVFSGALSDAEIKAIGASATCGTVSAPPVKKKCKKHKRKHRAADAKKKKCKKKKKR
jgi:hypothetical protein